MWYNYVLLVASISFIKRVGVLGISGSLRLNCSEINKLYHQVSQDNSNDIMNQLIQKVLKTQFIKWLPFWLTLSSIFVNYTLWKTTCLLVHACTFELIFWYCVTFTWQSQLLTELCMQIPGPGLGIYGEAGKKCHYPNVHTTKLLLTWQIVFALLYCFVFVVVIHLCVFRQLQVEWLLLPWVMLVRWPFSLLILLHIPELQ